MNMSTWVAFVLNNQAPWSAIFIIKGSGEDGMQNIIKGSGGDIENVIINPYIGKSHSYNGGSADD